MVWVVGQNYGRGWCYLEHKARLAGAWEDCRGDHEGVARGSEDGAWLDCAGCLPSRPECRCIIGRPVSDRPKGCHIKNAVCAGDPGIGIRIRGNTWRSTVCRGGRNSGLRRRRQVGRRNRGLQRRRGVGRRNRRLRARVRVRAADFLLPLVVMVPSFHRIPGGEENGDDPNCCEAPFEVHCWSLKLIRDDDDDHDDPPDRFLQWREEIRRRGEKVFIWQRMRKDWVGKRSPRWPNKKVSFLYFEVEKGLIYTRQLLVAMAAPHQYTHDSPCTIRIGSNGWRNM